MTTLSSDPRAFPKSKSGRLPRRGLAHFAESAEQNVPVPLSASGFVRVPNQSRHQMRTAYAYLPDLANGPD